MDEYFEDALVEQLAIKPSVQPNMLELDFEKRGKNIVG